MADRLVVKGAREHNLRSIDLDLPRDSLIVFTGLSGSGKSSLAFDTIFAEGQRRYVESLSAYARQFLGQMDKPDVDFIEGLSPAVSIDQKSTNRNPRSTVGTITEVYDYLRLLYARAGEAGDHDQAGAGQVEADVLEVVGACAADADEVQRHRVSGRGEGDVRGREAERGRSASLPSRMGGGKRRDFQRRAGCRTGPGGAPFRPRWAPAARHRSGPVPV